MGKCVYFQKNHYGYLLCVSSEHPSYSSKRGGALLGDSEPSECNKAGKGCPIYMKEIKNVKKK